MDSTRLTRLKKTMVLGVVFVLALFFGLANYGWTGEKDLVAYWKFDEGKGNIAKDAANGENNGKIHGATWIKGKVDNALSFDGENDYVDCGNHSSLNITDAITIEVWVKTSDTKNMQFVIGKGNTSYNGWYVAIGGSGKVITVHFTNGSSTVNLLADYSTGEWAHIVGTYDVPDAKIYLNGQLIDSGTLSDGIDDLDVNLWIGQIAGSGGNDTRFFNGTIDEVAIYNKALSAKEIKMHYNRNKPPLCKLVIGKENKVMGKQTDVPYPSHNTTIRITPEKERQVRQILEDDAAIRKAMKSVRPPDPARGGENILSRQYYDSLLKWVKYIDPTFRVWEGRPDCGHFFGDQGWTLSDRIAVVYAILAKFGDYNEEVTGIPREVLLKRAIAGIRYSAFTHDLGPKDCVRVNGGQWAKWGGLFKTGGLLSISQIACKHAYMGLAAWILWEDLDEEIQRLVANIVIATAERWTLEEPGSNYLLDTMAEENGIVTKLLTFTVNMFPGHPRAPAWEESAYRWMMNVRTVPADRSDETVVEGRSVSEWVTTTNLLPDFTLENHGINNASYLGSCVGLPGRVWLWYLLGGREVPETNKCNLGHSNPRNKALTTEINLPK